MDFSIEIDESVLSNIKKGDTVRIVYEALNVDCNCTVEDVDYNSIKLKTMESK